MQPLDEIRDDHKKLLLRSGFEVVSGISFTLQHAGRGVNTYEHLNGH